MIVIGHSNGGGRGTIAEESDIAWAQNVAAMLPDYYKLRGWDENGIPTSEKLAQLGLSQKGGHV